MARKNKTNSEKKQTKNLIKLTKLPHYCKNFAKIKKNKLIKSLKMYKQQTKRFLILKIK